MMRNIVASPMPLFEANHELSKTLCRTKGLMKLQKLPSPIWLAPPGNAVFSLRTQMLNMQRGRGDFACKKHISA